MQVINRKRYTLWSMRQHRLRGESSSKCYPYSSFPLYTRFGATHNRIRNRHAGAHRQRIDVGIKAENFTRRKAASINYETYTSRGDMTKQKSRTKFTAKLNARGHRFCVEFSGETRFASRRAVFPPPLPFHQPPSAIAHTILHACKFTS